MTKPEITEQRFLHLSGQGCSRLSYHVLVDGQRTGIVHTCETDGPPHYHITENSLSIGTEAIDLRIMSLAARRAWIIEHTVTLDGR